VAEVEAIVHSTFPKNIVFESDLPGDLKLTLGDSTQLYQVLLNLCVNARDAMPEGGQLAIRGSNCSIDAQYAMLHPGSSAGKYIVLEVADTGVGMAKETANKIFDPFFTTKPVGMGTGLGLSTTLGILRAHGGFITVDSREGRGSTFGVYLPAQANCPPLISGVDPDASSLPRGNGELIMLVDDEPAILSVTRQTLEAFGYRVVTADDGAHALAMYPHLAAEVALVFTDILMPTLDGPSLILELQRLSPKLPIIATSGSAQSAYCDSTGTGTRHFLPKPYSAESLLHLVHEVLTVGG